MDVTECTICHKPYDSLAAADACCTDDDETFGDSPFWRSVN